MRIVVIASRFPYPIITGDRLRLYHQIKYLSQFHDIHLIAISKDAISELDQSPIKAFCEEVHIFQLPKSKRYVNVLAKGIGKLPFQVSYFYNNEIDKGIKRLISTIKPDLAYFQLVRTAPYAMDLELPTVMDYMDAFSTIAQRDADVSTGMRRNIFNIEARRLREYEKKIADSFDGKITISENDKKLLSIPNMATISNGVNVEYFQPSEGMKVYDICFIGNLGYAPNIRAIRYLVKEVIPRIAYKLPELRVLIAGARPDKKLYELANDVVDIKGPLDDIRIAYAASKIFIAPIFTGAGQQNKILEAMAMGLPCITTSIVNSSINASTDQIKIAFSKDDFIKFALRLLNSEELAASVRTEALDFVHKNFSWKVQGEKLDDYLKSVVASE